MKWRWPPIVDDQEDDKARILGQLRCTVYLLACLPPSFHQYKTSLSQTNRATHLCNCNGVADLPQTPSPRLCYQAECGHSRSNHVRISSGQPAEMGCASATLLGCRAWLTARKQAHSHVLPRPILSFFFKECSYR